MADGYGIQGSGCLLTCLYHFPTTRARSRAFVAGGGASPQRARTSASARPDIDEEIDVATQRSSPHN